MSPKPTTPEDSKRLDLIFKALSSEVRRNAIENILHKPDRQATVRELADLSRFEVSPPLMHTHLKMLTRAGLISVQTPDHKIGRKTEARVYSVRTEELLFAKQWLSQRWIATI